MNRDFIQEINELVKRKRSGKKETEKKCSFSGLRSVFGTVLYYKSDNGDTSGSSMLKPVCVRHTCLATGGRSGLVVILSLGVCGDPRCVGGLGVTSVAAKCVAADGPCGLIKAGLFRTSCSCWNQCDGR